jgi:histidinol-phosphatase (PHP family)
MKLGNLHTHTTFCDGKSMPETLVFKAFELGFDTIGFSGHSPLRGCDNWCMSEERVFLYVEEINRLKEKYKGWINILCGVEQDFYSPEPQVDYDYRIGSVHCFDIGGILRPVDAKREMLKSIIDECFGGNFLNMAKAYYELEASVVERTHCDIIGHFDLITKFNKLGYFFDEDNPTYQDMALSACDKLLKTGKPFELNTGAMARGHLGRAYPAPFIIDYIKSHGGKLILTSDCHDLQFLDFAFDKYIPLADAMTLDDLKK